MAIRYLYLVRHGQYHADENAAVIDGSLSKLGIKQALKAAQTLKHLPITMIHISSLQRTKQTAEPIIAAFPDAKVEYTRRLWESTPYVSDEIADYFTHMPAEALAKEGERAQKAFEHYFRPTRGENRHEILVTHANMIRYFVCRVLRIDPARWLTMQSYNCGITRVSIDFDGYCTLISYNDIGHLPPTMQTDNFHAD